jgi:hypothetical protein
VRAAAATWPCAASSACPARRRPRVRGVTRQHCTPCQHLYSRLSIVTSISIGRGQCHQQVRVTGYTHQIPDPIWAAEIWRPPAVNRPVAARVRGQLWHGPGCCAHAQGGKDDRGSAGGGCVRRIAGSGPQWESKVGELQLCQRCIFELICGTRGEAVGPYANRRWRNVSVVN